MARAWRTSLHFCSIGGGHDDPVRLKANAEKSFVGSYVLGWGLPSTTPTGKDRHSACRDAPARSEDPRNSEVIFPYIGGQEVNNHRRHNHHRFVVNFWDYPLERTDLWDNVGDV